MQRKEEMQRNFYRKLYQQFNTIIFIWLNAISKSIFQKERKSNTLQHKLSLYFEMYLLNLIIRYVMKKYAATRRRIMMYVLSIKIFQDVVCTFFFLSRAFSNIKTVKRVIVYFPKMIAAKRHLHIIPFSYKIAQVVMRWKLLLQKLRCFDILINHSYLRAYDG